MIVGTMRPRTSTVGNVLYTPATTSQAKDRFEIIIEGKKCTLTEVVENAGLKPGEQLRNRFLAFFLGDSIRDRIKKYETMLMQVASIWDVDLNVQGCAKSLSSRQGLSLDQVNSLNTTLESKIKAQVAKEERQLKQVKEKFDPLINKEKEKLQKERELQKAQSEAYAKAAEDRIRKRDARVQSELSKMGISTNTDEAEEIMGDMPYTLGRDLSKALSSDAELTEAQKKDLKKCFDNEKARREKVQLRIAEIKEANENKPRVKELAREFRALGLDRIRLDRDRNGEFGIKTGSSFFTINDDAKALIESLRKADQQSVGLSNDAVKKAEILVKQFREHLDKEGPEELDIDIYL